MLQTSPVLDAQAVAPPGHSLEPEVIRATLMQGLGQRFAGARLLVNVLEPAAPDSMAAWGDFNNAFERKEYMEAYVAEEEAERMLARDPALKADFERRLREDAAFAASPAARLEFFYRRHPAWDQDTHRYPVLRIDRAP